MSFVVYDSVETVDKFRDNGFINWDGSPTEESIEAEERLQDYFGW